MKMSTALMVIEEGGQIAVLTIAVMLPAFLGHESFSFVAVLAAVAAVAAQSVRRRWQKSADCAVADFFDSYAREAERHGAPSIGDFGRRHADGLRAEWAGSDSTANTDAWAAVAVVIGTAAATVLLCLWLLFN